MSKSLLERRDAVVPRGVPLLSDLCIARGEGVELVTADGRRLIDFATGIGVMGLGHGAPDVVAAVQQQAAALMHTCIHVATYEPYVALCERLAELLPHGERTKALLVNSGAEAVENAIKIARQFTGRPAVLAFTGAFHGRTLLAATLTSKVGTKRGCGPFAPEVYRIDFPDAFRRGDGLDEARFVEREIQRLREAFVTVVDPAQLCAVIIEPLQGEGGFVPCPAPYLRALREVCDEHGVLLICDEVQSGFCRTGTWAAYEHAGVTPDLSTWAKSLGGGLPIAAVVGRADVMDGAVPGTIGGTYGGNPVACASALATLKIMQERDLCARARAIGETMRARLEALHKRCPLVADVRGIGAMIALELTHGAPQHAPASEQARAAILACREQGLLVIPAGAHGNIIRLLPPLVVDDATLARAMDVLEAAVLAAV
ncbi:MAG: aspartate aminotransferase family protein [Myxococcales bacterium]|nr:aspartate aminotransferase family protein [Myxococcales bacterium]